MSKARLPIVAGLVSGAVLVCIAAFVAHAQLNVTQIRQPGVAPAAGGGGAANAAAGQFKITNITRPDLRDATQRAQSLGNRSGSKQKLWGVFDVTFDASANWTDEISITYFVMLQNDRPGPNEKPMTLFTATYNYADVKGGRDNKAGVVLAPNTLERYGKPLGFAVQIIAGGGVADEKGLGNLPSKDKWWTDNTVLNHQNVQRRDGLVERSKSVFALVDTDSYEIAK